MLHFYNIAISIIDFFGPDWTIAIVYTIVGLVLSKVIRVARSTYHSYKLDNQYKKLHEYIHEHYREILITLIKKEISDLHISE